MTAAELAVATGDLQGLVETLPLVVYTAPLDADDVPRFIAPQVEDLLGIPADEFTFSALRGGIHPDDRDAALTAFDAADAARRDLCAEYRFVRPDGRIVWIEDSSRVVRIDGVPVAQGYLLDVTLRKHQEGIRARQAAVRSRLVAIGRHSLEGAAHDDVIDEVLDLLQDDLAAEVGAYFEPVAGRLEVTHWFGWDVVPGPALEGTPARTVFESRTTYAGRTFARPGSLLEQRGMRSTIAVPVVSADDVCVGVLTIHATEEDAFETLDVALVEQVANMIAAVIARERLDAHLLHAQRLEAVGRLAAGVAHDFNNMLTVIAGYADLARSHADDEGGRQLDQVGEAAGRARALTGQLLAFSREQVLEVRPVRLERLVDALAPMLVALVGDTVSVTTSGGSVTVLADAAKLEHVLFNLVANARDAMPSGGALAIEVGVDDVDPQLALAHGVEPGRYGTLRVTDTGEGMPPEVRERIFEPFFTTKPAGAGTGLGLASAYGTVRQSGGFITVQSETGVGSSFTIHLPLTDAARAVAAERAPASECDGPARVLLVEDEAIVRGLVEEQLQDLGHEVTAVASGVEALAELAGGAYDAVVSDVGLPGMDGVALAATVRERFPTVGIVLASGYPRDYLGERHDAADGVLLHKPFTGAELQTAVARVLAE